MGSIKIKLPIPSSHLSPNARVHWAVKAKKTKAHKTLALVEIAKIMRLDGFKAESYQLHFVFPDNRRRDFDNFTGRCKAYLDGISEAINQDDSEWNMAAPSKEVVKGESFVVITLNQIIK